MDGHQLPSEDKRHGSLVTHDFQLRRKLYETTELKSDSLFSIEHYGSLFQCRFG